MSSIELVYRDDQNALRVFHDEPNEYDRESKL